jgi:DNA helicase-2/ATP-dependent DNA helicase PcrA
MESTEFHVGDRVMHPQFGEGLVLDAKGKGEDVTLVVSFSGHGQRKLLVRLARLTLVQRTTPIGGGGR